MTALFLSYYYVKVVFSMTWLWILLAIVVVLVLWFIGANNKLVRLRNDCQEGYSTMDVYLKQRFDLIPNLVETVKGYAKHETDTLQAVVNARNSGAQQTTEERIKDENAITGAMRQIFALAESYPDLKANQNFVDLQAKLTKMEEDIANARKYYNAVVKQYNNACMTIPTSIVANLGGFKPAAMFEVDDTAERQNVKVQF